MLDERGKGFALGASEYLVKPVGRREVQNALERCVHGGGVASRTVLVIDDDPRAVALLEATFADQGYAVLTASGGEQGLELARRELPAVVLLDLLMPGIDGFAVVERLRADPATAAIPIVILTSKTMTPDDKHRLNGQISYLAHKGEFDREALIELVGRLSRVASPA
jgi:CheY-like chemotaxis protein